MAITTPPEIAPYPEAPRRGQPESVFIPTANTFVASLEPRRVEMQALADWMKTAGDTISQELGTAVSSATQAAEAARDDAQLAKTGAQTAQGLAEGARDDALDAAEAAEGAARTFDNTAEGLAATGDGEYFTVPAQDASGYLSLYRNGAGVATLIRTSPSDQVLTDTQAARDAAQTAEHGAAASLSAVQDLADFYPDVATALGATVDGDHFRVMASGNTAANLYRNDAGSETLIGTFPTEEGLQAWEQKLRQDIVNLVKEPSEIPVKTLFFLGESGSFIDVSSEGV